MNPAMDIAIIVNAMAVKNHALPRHAALSAQSQRVP
jgi:hypothetical protein